MAGKPIDEIAICFSFAYNWLRGWCEISEPITDGRKAKPKLFRVLSIAISKLL